VFRRETCVQPAYLLEDSKPKVEGRGVVGAGTDEEGAHISLGFIGLLRQVDSSADMKGGPEAHFLAGQIFTLGIAAIAVVPRMPSDSHLWAIGGKLSFPFRRSLLGLIILGLVRVICFHVRPVDANEFLLALDGIFGTIHVICRPIISLFDDSLSATTSIGQLHQPRRRRARKKLGSLPSRHLGPNCCRSVGV
jgi:hypothetical protein